MIVYLLIRAAKAIEDGKALKKDVKDLRAALHEATKVAIEILTDADAKMLLKMKWIDPLVVQLGELPQKVVAGLVEQVKAMSAKYAETFNDVEREMDAARGELGALLGELTGDEFDMKGVKALAKVVGGGK